MSSKNYKVAQNFKAFLDERQITEKENIVS